MKFYNMKIFLINNSPWPIICSTNLLILMMNLVNYFNLNSFLYLLVSFLALILIMLFWWMDLIIETTKNGCHNKYIIFFTMNSMIMFIISEIFFFISFFWTFFYSLFSPDIFIGSFWPSVGILSINYLSLPLLNSLFLISSGCSITWCHYKILSNKNGMLSLMITLILGFMFLICQFMEYKFSMFSFSDSIYGSIFFISTGFHGIHVSIGFIFLLLMLYRMNLNHFSSKHMLGFEFSIWYWHFVDLVWLYLYMMVYWLGA